MTGVSPDHRGLPDWPNGAAVAVSLTFDVDAEAGYLGEGDEYRTRLTSLSEGYFGVRRGIPRILRLLSDYEIHGTFFVPGYTAEKHLGLVERLLEGGHEVAHHGYLHLRSDRVSVQAQQEEIEQGFAALRAAGAGAVAGYRSTSWELTPATMRLLLDHGLLYDSSLMADDRPYLITHRGRTLLELPVHWSLDDWPHFGWSIDSGGNTTAATELCESWLAELRHARRENRHVTYTMHPEVIGRGYRFLTLERLVKTLTEEGDIWFARLDEIAKHIAGHLTDPVEVE
jgi:peptidoglycan/xylan/chitin deacetylase (PgdA/CDA1 family)